MRATPAPAKLKLTANEMSVVVRMLGRGRTLAQAIDAIQAQRDYLAQRTLTLTPTPRS
jgi:hypothetical protein